MQDEGTSGDDGLAHREDAEDGVFLHWFLSLDVHVPVSLELYNFPLSGDDRDCTGNFLVVNVALYDCGRLFQLFAGHAGVLGLGSWDFLALQCNEAGQEPKGEDVLHWDYVCSQMSGKAAALGCYFNALIFILR